MGEQHGSKLCLWMKIPALLISISIRRTQMNYMLLHGIARGVHGILKKAGQQVEFIKAQTEAIHGQCSTNPAQAFPRAVRLEGSALQYIQKTRGSFMLSWTTSNQGQILRERILLPMSWM